MDIGLVRQKGFLHIQFFLSVREFKGQVMKKVVFAAMLILTAVFAVRGSAVAAAALNSQMNSFYTNLLTEARKTEPSLKSFTADEGRKFFTSKHLNKENGEERSCAKCHTLDPKQKGQTPVGKAIEPMAMSVNVDRFTDQAKVEKWLKRNCLWVMGRECSAREKGDFISYMMSL